jgi:phosphoribosylanthranilate isomerase
MSLHVKICGVTDSDAAMAASNAGADAVGFVFADSVRRIDPRDAARIAARMPGRVQRVAVFLRPEPDHVARVLSEFPADVVQVDYGAITKPEGPLLLPVFREGDDEILGEFLDGTVARRFHYEGRKSGEGRTVDWGLAARYARRGQMTIAGGLTPTNVAKAVRTVKPFGVDVSSGVESAPGVKDVGRIRDFIETVRHIEKESVTT